LFEKSIFPARPGLNTGIIYKVNSVINKPAGDQQIAGTLSKNTLFKQFFQHILKLKIMKLKTISMLRSLLLLSMLATSIARAQQPKQSPPARPATGEISTERNVGDYSYRILPAPNNAFGFVVLQNGKMIFQHPTLKFIAENGRIYLVKKAEADRAAIITIEKIKKRISPKLTNEELRPLIDP
jgi:hypothetical protein